MQNKKFFLTITGGGTECIGELLRNGGASSWFCDAYVPYSKESVDSFLCFAPEKYNSERTARQLAMATFRKALRLGFKLEDIHAVGVCASLKSEGEREGREHSFSLCDVFFNAQFVWSFKFKGNLSRQEQEKVISDFITSKENYNKREAEVSKFSCTDMVDSFKEVVFGTDKLWKKKEVTPVIYSGSFNPLHDGHKAIIEHAEKTYGPVTLDISIDNYEKPSLDLIDMYDRKCRLENEDINFCFSKAPLFIDKMHLYPPKTIFIMGSDTAARIVKDRSFAEVIRYKKYYENRFIVYPREGYEVPDITYLTDLIFEFEHVSDFSCLNISSTQIRNEACL